MTLPSDNDSGHVEQRINQALDHSVEQLPQTTKDSLYKARLTALSAMHNKAKPKNLSWQIRQLIAHPLPKVAVPVTAALLVALSWQYGTVESVPQLPIAMMSEDMPSEDLALLEDLEFVTWLAQEQAAAAL